ncbi:hypothetical protein HK101_011658 [Irineochytrium annulatum]|nr:hypothetical protein HK101_011658 [Irineochytrium annulatum]
MSKALWPRVLALGLALLGGVQATSDLDGFANWITNKGNASVAGGPPLLTISYTMIPAPSAPANWLQAIQDTFSVYLYFYVKNNTDLHPAIRSMQVTTTSLTGLDIPSTIQTALSVAQNPSVVGIIGAGLSNLTAHVATVANAFRVPVCDGLASSAALSSETNFPTFFRSIPPDTQQALGILTFIKQQGWSHFNIIASTDEYGTDIALTLFNLASNYGLNVVSRNGFEPGTADFLPIVKALQNTQVTINVYAGTVNDFVGLMALGEQYNLTQEGNVWIGTDLTSAVLGVTIGLKKAMDLLTISLEMYIMAYDRILKKHPEIVPKGPHDVWNITKYVFPDVMTETGPIKLDENGDRITSFNFFYYNNSGTHSYKFATFHMENGLNITDTPHYMGLTAKKPLDRQREFNILGPHLHHRTKRPTSEYCPIGQGFYSNGIIESCLLCPKGTYNIDPLNEGVCDDCPDGVNCLGGKDFGVAAGYWLTPVKDPLLDKEVLHVYRCPNPLTCCPGGNCTVENNCAAGFKGIQCTECVDPKAYFWRDECVKCDKGMGVSFWLLLFGTFIGACAIILVPEGETPTIEILFFYFQVVNYIYTSDLGGEVKLGNINIFFAITSLNFDGMVSDCPVPISGLSKLMFRFLLPTLLLFHVSLIFCVLKLVQSKSSGSHSMLERLTPYWLKGQSVSLICLRAIGSMILFALMPLVESSLTIEIEGVNVVAKVPQIVCMSQPHIGPAIFAIIVLVILLGVVPCGLCFMLYRLWSMNGITYDADASPGQRLFQTLYISFKPELFFMLPVIILEKGLVCVLFTLMGHYDDGTQQNAHILILACLCAIRIYCQPYFNPLEAYLNREICIGWLVLIAFRFYALSFPVSLAIQIEVSIVVGLPFVLHAMRWMWTNKDYHADIVSAVTSGGVSSVAGAHAKHEARKARKSGVTNRSIEKLAKTENGAFSPTTHRRSIMKTNAAEASVIPVQKEAGIPEHEPLNPNGEDEC